MSPRRCDHVGPASVTEHDRFRTVEAVSRNATAATLTTLTHPPTRDADCAAVAAPRLARSRGDLAVPTDEDDEQSIAGGVSASHARYSRWLTVAIQASLPC